jgi:hypothetical protein
MKKQEIKLAEMNAVRQAKANISRDSKAKRNVAAAVSQLNPAEFVYDQNVW